MQSGTERRRAPRSRAEMPLTLSMPGESAAARVMDISLSGVRCMTDRPVAVMTQVGLEFVVPGMHPIECRGAVVRSRKLGDGESRYETAVFFTSMAEPDRIKLQEFLQTPGD